MWITDNSDPRCFEEARVYGAEENRRVNTEHESRPHFNGYGVPPDSSTTVADLMAYYVEGKKGRAGLAPSDPERAREIGQPVCGDMTARWRSWRGPAGHWPKHEEAGTPYPGPRREPEPDPTTYPAPMPARTPPGAGEALALF
ncbi:hypothetical protein [Micrococcus luteus]|uniref:hypothetical protein n=1 Tax=Micrococcus luteus TaxID=1270 RepID=UPI00366CD86B